MPTKRSSQSSPRLALSIRQPWAWIILHGGKDIENRSWHHDFTGPLLIHAGKTMTRRYFDDAVKFAEKRGVIGIPSFEEIKAKHCGGIVGEVTVTDYVTRSRSRWFSPEYEGDVGWVLTNPKPRKLKPCRGYQKLFEPKFD